MYCNKNTNEKYVKPKENKNKREENALYSEADIDKWMDNICKIHIPLEMFLFDIAYWEKEKININLSSLCVLSLYIYIHIVKGQTSFDGESDMAHTHWKIMQINTHIAEIDVII